MILSIIILNYKSEKFADKCLQSLKKNPCKYETEILVVNNDKESQEFLSLKEKWQDFAKFYSTGKNLGYGQGNQFGVGKSKGEFIAIINPDIEIYENTLNELMDFLKNNNKAAIVGPRLIYPDGATQDSFRKFPNLFDMMVKRIPFLRKKFEKRIAKFLMWDVDFTKAIRVDWIVGAFFIIKRKAWDDVEGFDKRYFLFMEDTDLCRKLWMSDWEVRFYPLCQARHHHDRLSDTNGIADFFKEKTVRIHLVSAFKYFLKWSFKKNPRKKERL